MKIYFFEIFGEREEYLKSKLKGNKLKFFKSALKKSHLSKIKDCEVLCTFVESKIDSKIIEKLPKLKVIVTMSTGFDHIDIETCKKLKIKVLNIPTYGENTVAEHAFALVLALSRKIYPSIKRTHEEKRFNTDTSLEGFDISGKTIGIVGVGNIGSHVVRMANGFNMKILGCSRSPRKELSKKFGLKLVSLKKLLKESDIVTLHIPYSKENHHLINSKNISLMKKGAILINTARGGLVDTSALILALKSRHLRGVGLDVLENECDIKEENELLTKEFKKKCDMEMILEKHHLMNLDNVLITPHNAFNSKEAIIRILDSTIKNIKSYKRNKLINRVC